MTAHILVVDDVEKNVKLLADVLAVKGFRVSTAFSGEQALERIAAEAPDLVLLDVMMPGLSGYDVCRAMAAASTSGCAATTPAPRSKCMTTAPACRPISSSSSSRNSARGETR